MAQMTLEQARRMGLELHRAGRLTEAEEIYRQLLAVAPGDGDLLHLLGVLAGQLGRLEEAAGLIGRAVEISPGEGRFYNSLGKVLAEMRREGAAVESFEKAARLRPELAEAHYNLAAALERVGRREEAIGWYRRALAVRGDYGDALNNLGNALASAGDCDEAIACFRRALELPGDHARVLCNLGNALKNAGELDDALACFRRGMEMRPEWSGLESNLLYTLHFHAGRDGAAILAEHTDWSRRHAEPLRKFVAPHGNDRDPHRRLRVGYVSPDFRDHAECFFVMPLLAGHDHERFEIHCYSSVARPDAITQQMRGHADRWHDVAALSDERLAEKIRVDGIDVLVDLTMHMAENRALVFARKPAPVQAAWLAYPGTTGMEAMDYRITDAWMDPPGENDAAYVEASIRLSGCWCCYDPGTQTPEVGALPALAEGRVTFGSLNNFRKVNDEVLRLWGHVLAAVPWSRLMLLAPQGAARRRVAEFLGGCGVAAERLMFVGGRPRQEYLRLYQQMDIALDPFPYNGITTTCDALWMGVPVLSRVGVRASARAGLSVLSAAGLGEWAVGADDEYVRLAGELAGDLPRLALVRAGLRERVRASPLMDGAKFARAMEGAYREMWERWCAPG